MPNGEWWGWWLETNAQVDCTSRYAASDMNPTPISRSARRWRAWPVPDNSQITTVDAPISMRESRPKPASATDRAEIAATASTTMPTTFQPRVAYSRAKPRRSSAVRAVSFIVGIARVWLEPPRAACRASPNSARTSSDHPRLWTTPIGWRWI